MNLFSSFVIFYLGVVDNLTRLILVNAIHFKAKWANQFKIQDTRLAPFYITPTETVQVQMMSLYNKKFNYAYSEKLKAKILEMPYEVITIIC